MAGDPSDRAGPSGRPAQPPHTARPSFLASSTRGAEHQVSIKLFTPGPVTRRAGASERGPQQRLCAFTVPVQKSFASLQSSAPAALCMSIHLAAFTNSISCVISKFLLCLSHSPGQHHQSLCPLPFQSWQFIASCFSLASHPELKLHLHLRAEKSQCSSYSFWIGNSSYCNGRNICKCQIH